MIYRLTFHPQALIEYNTASIWYETQLQGLGARFENAIDSKINEISSDPLSFSLKYKQYRQAVVKAFPFVIVFKVTTTTKEIYISSIHHTRRDPRGKYRPM